MSDKDQFDEQSERLSPCVWNVMVDGCYCFGCAKRPAVAAALREAAKPHGLMLTGDLAKLLTDKDNEIANLRAEKERLEYKVAETAGECGVPHDNDFDAAETLDRIIEFYADLRAEVERLKLELNEWETVTYSKNKEPR